MKTTTTTREYDAEGRLVKETVSEIVTPDAPIPAVTYSCTCGTSAMCALHRRYYWQPTWYSAVWSAQCGTIATNRVELS